MGVQLKLQSIRMYLNKNNVVTWMVSENREFLVRYINLSHLRICGLTTIPAIRDFNSWVPLKVVLFSWQVTWGKLSL